MRKVLRPLLGRIGRVSKCIREKIIDNNERNPTLQDTVVCVNETYTHIRTHDIIIELCFK